MTRGWCFVMCAATCVAPWVGAPLAGQSDISVELGGSRVGPPTGVDAATVGYAVGGLRASYYWLDGSGVSASVMLGRTLGESTGGDFFSGTLAAGGARDLGGGFSIGADARLLGFEVQAPFPYRAFAVEGGPVLRLRQGPVSARIAGTVGAGRSRVEVRRRMGSPVRVVEDELRRAGASAEVLVGAGGLWFGLGGAVHGTDAGDFRQAGARAVLGLANVIAELRIERWDTPYGLETTGGLSLSVPINGWSMRGFVGKSEPDPLTLAEPGSGSSGVLVGRSLYRSSSDGPRATLYERLRTTETGARVRLAVEAPAGTTAVQLLGDFTLWEPIPMRREGDRWTAEVDVPAGTHHFGFLVNDEWYVPDDAPDVVADEWGRRNATLVIEGAGR